MRNRSKVVGLNHRTTSEVFDDRKIVFFAQSDERLRRGFVDKTAHPEVRAMDFEKHPRLGSDRFFVVG